MIRRNGIRPEDVASAIFTTTTDLNAEFPALAARQLGWTNVALMCFHELDVPGSLRKCIRILIHWNTDKPAHEIQHVYIKGAANLRPDLSELPPVDWEELERWIAEHLDQNARSAALPYPEVPPMNAEGASQSKSSPDQLPAEQ
jgi:chorismate mutase